MSYTWKVICAGLCIFAAGVPEKLSAQGVLNGLYVGANLSHLRIEKVPPGRGQSRFTELGGGYTLGWYRTYPTSERGFYEASLLYAHKQTQQTLVEDFSELGGTGRLVIRDEITADFLEGKLLFHRIIARQGAYRMSLALGPSLGLIFSAHRVFDLRTPEVPGSIYEDVVDMGNISSEITRRYEVGVLGAVNFYLQRVGFHLRYLHGLTSFREQAPGFGLRGVRSGTLEAGLSYTLSFRE